MAGKKKAKSNKKSQHVTKLETTSVQPPQAPPAKTDDEWKVIVSHMREMLGYGKEPATHFLDIIKCGIIHAIDLGHLHELYCEINYGKHVNSKTAMNYALKALKYYGNDDSLIRYPETYLMIIGHFKTLDLSKAMMYWDRAADRFGCDNEIKQEKIRLQILEMEGDIADINRIILETEEETEKKAAAAAIAKKKGKGKVVATDTRIDIEVQEDHALVVEAVDWKEKETEKDAADIEEKFKFEARYDMVIDEDKGDGSMWYADEIEVAVRLFQVNCDNRKNFDKYRQLCASDEGLLTVVHMAKHPKKNDLDHYLMISDDVYTFHEYLELLRNEFSQEIDQSEKAWWRLIAHRFRLFFRGVAEALIFLYGKEKRSNGNLHTLYVTKQGRPRIQPCPDGETTNMQDDAQRFLVLMKQMLFSPFDPQDINEDAFDFPLELKHLLTFIANYKGLLPAKVVLHHPFFWTISEKIEYPGKLSEAMHERGVALSKLNTDLKVEFDGWKNRLPQGGIYHRIWQYGDPEKQVPEDELKKSEPFGLIQVAKYHDAASIIRYFSNVVDHVNDLRFRSLRTEVKKYLPPKILEDLTCLYPSFYVKVYEAVAICISELSLHDCCDELIGLKTKDSEFQALV